MPIVQAGHLRDQNKRLVVVAGRGRAGKIVVVGGLGRRKGKMERQLWKGSSLPVAAVEGGKCRETVEADVAGLGAGDGVDEKGRRVMMTTMDDRWLEMSVDAKNLKRKGPFLSLCEGTSSLRIGEQPWTGLDVKEPCKHPPTCVCWVA